LIICVIGLPGSGKTTYVKKTKEENDLVYDFDYLVDAFSYCGIHAEERPESAKWIANSLLESLINNYQDYTDGNLYIIRTIPNKREVELFANYNIKYIGIKTSAEKCRERLIKRDGFILQDFDLILERYTRNLRHIPPDLLEWV